MDTRYFCLSEQQVKALINLLGPLDQITVDPETANELRDMFEDSLQNSDSEMMNDFTA